MSMRARYDSQRTARFICIVQRKPKYNHVVQNGSWWLHVGDAGFERPAFESGKFHFTANGDAEILVPRDLPVSLWCLVEKNSANNMCLRAGDTLDYCSHALGIGQLTDEGSNIKQVPD